MCGRVDFGNLVLDFAFFGISLFTPETRSPPKCGEPVRYRRTPGQIPFFEIHCSIHSNARCKFSMEFATLNLKYPSPNSPNDVPERQATPASSSSASAMALDCQPVPVTLGKT